MGKPKSEKWDERWCLVVLRLRGEPARAGNLIERTDQCEHAQAPGRYVVLSKGEWCGFDPATKIQALAWANKKPEREARIMWLCGECGEIMPLGSYSPEAQKHRPA